MTKLYFDPKKLIMKIGQTLQLSKQLPHLCEKFQYIYVSVL